MSYRSFKNGEPTSFSSEYKASYWLSELWNSSSFHREYINGEPIYFTIAYDGERLNIGSFKYDVIDRKRQRSGVLHYKTLNPIYDEPIVGKNTYNESSNMWAFKLLNENVEFKNIIEEVIKELIEKSDFGFLYRSTKDTIDVWLTDSEERHKRINTNEPVPGSDTINGKGAISQYDSKTIKIGVSSDITDDNKFTKTIYYTISDKVTSKEATAEIVEAFLGLANNLKGGSSDQLG